TVRTLCTLRRRGSAGRSRGVGGDCGSTEAETGCRGTTAVSGPTWPRRVGDPSPGHHDGPESPRPDVSGHVDVVLPDRRCDGAADARRAGQARSAIPVAGTVQS